MLDSQRYPVNLYLSNNEKKIVNIRIFWKSFESYSVLTNKCKICLKELDFILSDMFYKS